MPSTKLAKWKTAAQITALSVLLIGDAGWAALHLVEVGLGLLWVAGVLTLVTGYDYLRAGLKHMVDEQPNGSQSSDAPQPPTRRAG